jgi:hypothetical protein
LIEIVLTGSFSKDVLKGIVDMFFSSMMISSKAQAVLAATVTVAGCVTAPAFADLIVNGDFEAGNTGFNSSYVYSPSDGHPPGVYAVLADPSSWHEAFTNFGDHTSGSGLMMVVNGSQSTAGSEGNTFWEESVHVATGHQYVFSFWATSLYSQNPADLNVYLDINGASVSNWTLSAAVGSWAQYQVTWTAATDPTDIHLVDRNGEFSGNDFAVDDISLLAVVPLPASAWSGLAGLAGLGCFGVIRRRNLTRG